MFDPTYLEQFYDPDLVNHPDKMDEDFKKSYFMYIDVFCKATSPFWKKFLDDRIMTRNIGEYGPNLTKSDEALTLWLLQQEFKKAKEDADCITRIGPELWNKNREKRKRGQHMGLAKQSDYVTLYNKISAVRSDPAAFEFWQNQYFDYLFSIRGTIEIEAMNRKRAMKNSMRGEDESHPLPFDDTF